MNKTNAPTAFIFSLAAAAAVLELTSSVVSPSALAQSGRSVNAAMVDGWMSELSNWGRWASRTRWAAVNLITPAKRKQAASLVKDGVSVSLFQEHRNGEGRRQRLAVRPHHDFDG